MNLRINFDHIKNTIINFVLEFSHFTILLILSLFIGFQLTGQSPLPLEINRLFFEDSRFSSPIALQIPSESSLEFYEKISQNPDLYESGLPKLTIFDSEGGLKSYDSHLLSFLVKNGFATIDTKTQATHNSRYGSKSEVFHFIFYDKEFKNHFLGISKNKFGTSKEEFYIITGHRELLSVDYKNEYEDTPFGMRRVFYSIVFTYRLVSNFIELNKINRTFIGKAKAFLDPDDGRWKMEGPFEDLGIKLDDNGSREFMRIIQNNYSPFDFKKNEIESIERDVKRRDSIMHLETRLQATKDSLEFESYKLKYPYEITYPDGSFYRGGLIDDRKNGFGEYTDADGNKYEGYWKDDKKEGFGKMFWKNVLTVYEGEWKNNLVEGFGISIDSAGFSYRGSFIAHQKHGKGEIYDKNETKLCELFYQNGKLEGFNRYVMADEKMVFTMEGTFKNGLLSGQGTTIYKNLQDRESTTEKGEYRNGDLYNGEMIYVNSKGDTYIKKYKNGKAGKLRKL